MKKSKLFSDIVLSFFLIFLYLGIAIIWDSCGNKTKEAVDSLSDTTENTSDIFEADESTYENNPYENENSGEGYYDESEPTDVPHSNYADKTAPISTEASSSVSGKYMIVAGNFLVQENAFKMIERLNAMGYDDADWSVFDYSQYYTVIVSKSDNKSALVQMVNQLKAKGIDCYLHTKK